jgi:hypothetical protein
MGLLFGALDGSSTGGLVYLNEPNRQRLMYAYLNNERFTIMISKMLRDT